MRQRTRPHEPMPVCMISVVREMDAIRQSYGNATSTLHATTQELNTDLQASQASTKLDTALRRPGRLDREIEIGTVVGILLE